MDQDDAWRSKDGEIPYFERCFHRKNPSSAFFVDGNSTSSSLRIFFFPPLVAFGLAWKSPGWWSYSVGMIKIQLWNQNSYTMWLLLKQKSHIYFSKQDMFIMSRVPVAQGTFTRTFLSMFVTWLYRLSQVKQRGNIALVPEMLELISNKYQDMANFNEWGKWTWWWIIELWDTLFSRMTYLYIQLVCFSKDFYNCACTN